MEGKISMKMSYFFLLVILRLNEAFDLCFYSCGGIKLKGKNFEEFCQNFSWIYELELYEKSQKMFGMCQNSQ